MVTKFTETENGNYVSVGTIGKTYVAKTQDGWISGRVTKEAQTYDASENTIVYKTLEEAMEAVSADEGYLIHFHDKTRPHRLHANYNH